MHRKTKALFKSVFTTKMFVACVVNTSAFTVTLPRMTTTLSYWPKRGYGMVCTMPNISTIHFRFIEKIDCSNEVVACWLPLTTTYSPVSESNYKMLETWNMSASEPKQSHTTYSSTAHTFHQIQGQSCINHTCRPWNQSHRIRMMCLSLLVTSICRRCSGRLTTMNPACWFRRFLIQYHRRSSSGV